MIRRFLCRLGWHRYERYGVAWRPDHHHLIVHVCRHCGSRDDLF